MQYNNESCKWDNEAYLLGGLQKTTRDRAERLRKQFQSFSDVKTGEVVQDDTGWEVHDKFHLLCSLNFLLKVLDHTHLNVALHGPSVARGLQRGGEQMRLPNNLIWSTKVDSQDDMPMELMDLIEQYLELNCVQELPGLGTHTGTQTHYSPIARRASSTCQQCKKYQWLHSGIPALAEATPRLLGEGHPGQELEKSRDVDCPGCGNAKLPTQAGTGGCTGCSAKLHWQWLFQRERQIIQGYKTRGKLRPDKSYWVENRPRGCCYDSTWSASSARS